MGIGTHALTLPEVPRPTSRRWSASGGTLYAVLMQPDEPGGVGGPRGRDRRKARARPSQPDLDAVPAAESPAGGAQEPTPSFLPLVIALAFAGIVGTLLTIRFHGTS